jgi:histidyl-tRNA synthetase
MQTSSSKSLKAQLRQANNLGAHYAVIIGEQEIEKGMIILRNMTTSKQETLPLNELQDKLQRRLQ